MHQTIYPLFFNKGRDFKLSAIMRELKKTGGKMLANFKAETKVISCTLLNAFKSVFGDDWESKYEDNQISDSKEKKTNYTIEDLWHVLFTFDSTEKLKEFAVTKLHFDEAKTEDFIKI